jgi:hypothetical protein
MFIPTSFTHCGDGFSATAQKPQQKLARQLMIPDLLSGGTLIYADSFLL